jgi:hypothetical protein
VVPPEEVALRALMYRQIFLAGYRSLDDILADSDSAPGELSFLTLLAAEQFTPKDWACLSAVRRFGGNFLRAAREHPDPETAEVLLHAKPPRGVKSKKLWAQAFIGDRWDHVEILMATLERSGMSTTHDDIALTFSRAWRQLTGGDLDDYLDAREQYEDTAA